MVFKRTAYQSGRNRGCRRNMDRKGPFTVDCCGRGDGRTILGDNDTVAIRKHLESQRT